MAAKNRNRVHTLLIFPPVWTPVTPYLALPQLVAYLRREGVSTTQYDASRAFFLESLLQSETLLDRLEVTQRRDLAGDYGSLEGGARRLLEQIRARPGAWEEKIGQVRSWVRALRDAERFYEPEACIRAQNGIYDLLKLASLSYDPAAFTFNTFAHPGLTDFPSMMRFCDEEEENPFLGFYRGPVARKMESLGPSLVGISISTSHQLAGALTLSRYIKQTYPSVHVTLGGRHLLRLSEAFTERPAYLEAFCHSLILDSGERPLKALARHLTDGGDIHSVPNLVHYSSGRLIFNAPGPHEPISHLPTPDFTDLPLEAYLAPTPIIPVRLSEGCYWGKCTFCSRYDTRRFQTIPPQKAVDQMEALHRRHGATCFTVNDDCLTPTYLEAFARILSERDPGFQISLWCKPVGTFTGERLRLLSRAGVRLIRWGVETGHPRVLKLMNKGTRLKDTCRVLRDAAGAGIWNHATMILGFPTETEAEARETVRFLDQNQDIIHSSIFFRFVLLNHSYILNNPETFSIREVTKAENPFSYEYRFKMSRGMGAETLTRFFQWAQAYRLEEMYRHPFWFYLRIREYLLLYAARYDPKELRRWKVRPQDLSLYGLGRDIRYFFEKPDQVPADLLEEISALIKGGGEVGTSWIKDNLKGAFLIGYAMEGDRVIATMTHKVPLPRYVAQIEQKTHLDLDGYLERGYTHVRPEYRGLGVGDALLKGLVKRSPGKRIYVTINVDNLEPIQLTLRNHMRLAATYYNERTGHEVGVFVNRSTGESQTVREGVGERRAHGVKRA